MFSRILTNLLICATLLTPLSAKAHPVYIEADVVCIRPEAAIRLAVALRDARRIKSPLLYQRSVEITIQQGLCALVDDVIEVDPKFLMLSFYLGEFTHTAIYIYIIKGIVFYILTETVAVRSA